jgi:predicted Zn-dependent protease
LLANSGYAADGLWNLMVTLSKENKGKGVGIPWLSSHPTTKERRANLQGIIEQYGYNRYGFEGVVRHRQIKDRVKQILDQDKMRQQRSPIDKPTP